MHEPEIFEKLNKGTRDGTTAALAKFGHLIKWKPDHSDTILDVGCGPGNVLMNIILPEFKGKYSNCYATDLSDKMIDYAGKKYAIREDVKFLKMDIMNVGGFLAEHGPVDHVVSTFVVHYLPDQNTGLRNIFEILKPGGDFFTVHARDAAIFDFYEHMDQNVKWNKYFDNLKQFIPTSHKSNQPEEELRSQLSRCGFTEVFVDVIPNSITADNTESLKLLFSSGLAQIHNIPEEMRKEYIDDVFDYGVDHKYLTVLPSGEVAFKFNLFVAYGYKPE